MDNHEDDLCVCFHVSRQKICKYIRINRPQVVSQTTECFGAGTGCGWCIPFIEKIYESIMSDSEEKNPVLSQREYLARRLEYLKMARKSAEKPQPPEDVARKLPDQPESKGDLEEEIE